MIWTRGKDDFFVVYPRSSVPGAASTEKGTRDSKAVIRISQASKMRRHRVYPWVNVTMREEANSAIRLNLRKVET